MKLKFFLRLRVKSIGFYAFVEVIEAIQTQFSLSQQNLLKLEKVNPLPEGRSEAEGLSFGGGSIKFLAERIGEHNQAICREFGESQKLKNV